jgi:thioredoxin reductase
LDGARLADGRGELGGLFVGPRTCITTPIVKELGCAVDEGPTGAVICADEFKKTTVPGVFATGDAIAP